jgi:hypothetical protein
VTHRQVRVTPGFFEQLDAQLAGERGPQGEPSATDFIAIELPTIIEQFAERFDDLPEVIVGLESARMLIAPGVLVDVVVVYGLLASDGVIDLIGMAIDV